MKEDPANKFRGFEARRKVSLIFLTAWNVNDAVNGDTLTIKLHLVYLEVKLQQIGVDDAFRN